MSGPSNRKCPDCGSAIIQHAQLEGKPWACKRFPLCPKAWRSNVTTSEASTFTKEDLFKMWEDLQKQGLIPDQEFVTVPLSKPVRAVGGLIGEALASVALDGETHCVPPDPNAPKITKSKTCWNCGPTVSKKNLPLCQQCRFRFCGYCIARQVVTEKHTDPAAHMAHLKS